MKDPILKTKICGHQILLCLKNDGLIKELIFEILFHAVQLVFYNEGCPDKSPYYKKANCYYA
jgi:hypothetical protein